LAPIGTPTSGPGRQKVRGLALGAGDFQIQNQFASLVQLVHFKRKFAIGKYIYTRLCGEYGRMKSRGGGCHGGAMLLSKQVLGHVQKTKVALIADQCSSVICRIQRKIQDPLENIRKHDSFLLTKTFECVDVRGVGSDVRNEIQVLSDSSAQSGIVRVQKSKAFLGQYCL
jgi:hypothetical protein